MADIRINALATTAASTASDDFVAVDGSANGTRKLNAYSPTFGGNLTVSGGTATVGASGGGNGSLVLKRSSDGLTVGNLSVDTVNSLLNLGTAYSFATISTEGVERLRVGTITTTLAGNLTVSGTGTSTFSGILNVSGSTNYLKISTTGTPTSGAAALQLSFNGTNSRAIRLTNVDTGGRTYDIIAGGGGDAASFGLYDDTSGAYRMFIPSSGNVLIGTTTDSSNGKLQLATHTTSAGGIGFGTDISLWRNGTESVLLGGATASLLGLAVGGSRKAYFYHNGTQASLSSETGALVLLSNATTALTLDSSQNATFAGDITVSGGNVGVGGAAESNIGASFSGMNVSTSSGYAGMVMGLGATLNATANADDLYGLYFNPNLATAAKTGLNFYGARFAGFTASGGGTISNAIGISISNLGASGTVTNAYGIDIQAQSGASTTNVAIRAAGKVMFTSLPTSSAGLAAGSLWNDSGTVKIV